MISKFILLDILNLVDCEIELCLISCGKIPSINLGFSPVLASSFETISTTLGNKAKKI